MSRMKFMLFAVVALIAIGSTVAIIGGQDAIRAQFPYYAYLKMYKAGSIWTFRAVSFFSEERNLKKIKMWNES